MKLTTKILFMIFILMIAGLLASNMILKKQYDAIHPIKTSVICFRLNIFFLEPAFNRLSIRVDEDRVLEVAPFFLQGKGSITSRQVNITPFACIGSVIKIGVF